MSCYFQDIELHVIKHIRTAKSRVLIAVAWFTNSKIGNEIIQKKKLDIEVIIDDNDANKSCQNLKDLKANNIDVTFIKDLSKNYYLMHNKFCVIDNNTVITGSYNWTLNANTNDENITIIKDKIIAEHYSHEFRRIKNLKFPNESLFKTEEEIKEITETIYKCIVTLLKQNLNSLEQGLITKWKDEKVTNKLRTINERLHNSIHSKAKNYMFYIDLISKYGFEHKNEATEEDKAEIRDAINKKGLDEVDYYLHKEFQFFKIKAIKKLQDNYSKLLEKIGNDMNQIEKIYKVFKFISTEKRDMAEEIMLTSI